MKAEVDKPDINKLFNVPTSLNHLKTKIYELDVSELKILEKLRDTVKDKVVKNEKESRE